MLDYGFQSCDWCVVRDVSVSYWFGIPFQAATTTKSVGKQNPEHYETLKFGSHVTSTVNIGLSEYWYLISSRPKYLKWQRRRRVWWEALWLVSVVLLLFRAHRAGHTALGFVARRLSRKRWRKSIAQASLHVFAPTGIPTLVSLQHYSNALHFLQLASNLDSVQPIMNCVLVPCFQFLICLVMSCQMSIKKKHGYICDLYCFFPLFTVQSWHLKLLVLLLKVAFQLWVLLNLENLLLPKNTRSIIYENFLQVYMKRESFSSKLHSLPLLSLTEFLFCSDF